MDILRCSVKKFDCVKMMRDIRNKMVKRYQKSPELEMRELDEIRKKYSITKERKKTPSPL